MPAQRLTVPDALPVLTRARATRPEGAAGFWGFATVLALRFVARGLLLPGLTPEGRDSWRLGPLTSTDLAQVRDLAAAMPPHAHAVPLPDSDPTRLPEPTTLLRGFMDAVADGLPRSPAAVLATGSSPYAGAADRPLPELRGWATEVAAGHDTGLRLALRVEVAGLTGDPTGSATQAPLRDDDHADGTEDEHPAHTAGQESQEHEPALFRAVLQLHSPHDPTLVADAAEVWSGGSLLAADLGPRARADILLTLRRAAGVWEPLTPLLSSPVPDAVELSEEEAAELLRPATQQALEAAGLATHWPTKLVHTLTTRAVVGPESDDVSTAGTPGPARPGTHGSGHGLLSGSSLLAFSWRFAIGDQDVTRAELDRLAAAGRPLVRLRGQWVLIDPESLRRAQRRRDRQLNVVEALAPVLTGTAGEQDEQLPVETTGWLSELRDQLTAAHAGATDVDQPTPQPAALAATLRDYQLHGLDWLRRMTSLGLGCCLADDMGLGKTITLIALHLHRQGECDTAGPTLVVCPASMLGNWQREIERFAPGVPVRRYHGPTRSPQDLESAVESGGAPFVLTTYGTMRRDAATLAQPPGDRWGLVVADEAQHVKNPFSGTARQLRTLPAGARVALTGTPVENNLSELWAILDWTTPGLLGQLGTFRHRYADAAESGTDQAAAERLARIVRPFLLRRRKTDPGIAPELPAKTETDRAVALTREQVGLYEAVVRDGLAGLAGTDGLARRGRVVKLFTALKQICNHPAQYLKEEQPALDGRSGKLELLDELLDTLLAEDSRVLVFTQYVELARLLEEHLAERGIRTRLLHGGTPVARREKFVNEFQDGTVPVFLLSLRAAGTGLNLTRADHVVHYDRWWNPAVEAQATDRAYRIGQTRPVQVHRLITEGTIEDRIATMLERKQALADAVLETPESALTELSDAALAELVSLRESRPLSEGSAR
ncbi:DEAD/DEAH box helicase [Streptomyces oceani]